MASSSLDYDPPVPLVRELMREYAQQLNVDLCFQNFEEELAQLPGLYAAPKGCLMVVTVQGQPAGCAAYRPMSDEVCEMKRLYIRPGFRGLALGRQLVNALLLRAQEAGYRSIRLDTLPFMHSAIALYRSLGFQEIEPYCKNPIAGCLFFEATFPRVDP